MKAKAAQIDMISTLIAVDMSGLSKRFEKTRVG
jgi:hypothetical protein